MDLPETKLGEEMRKNADFTPQRDVILQFFNYEHLPPHLREYSKPFADLADWMFVNVPASAERTAAFRKLLEAKDCAVRARLAK